jgi:hypothetical protein
VRWVLLDSTLQKRSLLDWQERPVAANTGTMLTVTGEHVTPSLS